MVAVDAGVHLSAITRLIEKSLPCPLPSIPFTLTSGPFAGLSMPYASAAANAAYITRSLVDTYLITHPHLDHISGFVVNTAGFTGTKPKKLAALPSTILAFKNHIFNNVIWPNLSDENHGAGMVTYLRLIEGGSPALGDGEGRGYSEVCDGLLVKTWSVSHGHCMENHSHRGSISVVPTRSGSIDASSMQSRHSLSQHAQSLSRVSNLLLHEASASDSPNRDQERICVYDSSAYFIQDKTHRREVLIFGDVEPDSISLSPRNLQVWQEAAPKIVTGTLAAIFIECSYDDSQTNDRLFGHLKPEFVIQELQALAREVRIARKVQLLDGRKRKRSINAEEPPRRNPTVASAALDDPVSPRTVRHLDLPHSATPKDEPPLKDFEAQGPKTGTQRQLAGLKVVIIHVKERLDDGPDVGESIKKELQQHEKEVQLGCEFIISKSGQSFYL